MHTDDQISPANVIPGRQLRLQVIARRATALFDRREWERSSAEAVESEDCDELMRIWCHACCGGDSDAFRERLSWEGLDTASAHDLFRKSCPRSRTPPPEWLSTFALDQQPATTDTQPDRVLRLGEPIPFEEFFVPWVALARARLTAAADDCYAELDNQAHSDLERALLRRLSFTCERALRLELAIFRALAPPWKENGESAYQAFLAQYREDGLVGFFEVYPALARLTGSVIEQWLSAHLALLTRLRSDRDELALSFNSAHEMGKVTSVSPSLSDFHNGGQSVLGLTFASGLCLIYKPKHVGLEKCWNDFLVWVNHASEGVALHTFRVLPRDGYGWAEYVPSYPCRSRHEQQLFFRRAGMLVFLAYLFDATDLHNENVVRFGEHPVLIDLETLLHPWPHSEGAVDDYRAKTAPLRRSVLRSGLLPTANGTPDVSGFAAPRAEESTNAATKRDQPNTSEALMTGALLSPPSVPDNSPPYEASEIIEGFTFLYRKIMEHRDVLLRHSSPLWAFAAQQSRFVFRSTADYTHLLTESLRPNALVDGKSRSLLFESLHRAACGCLGPPSFWPVLKAEREALELMNVPLFAAKSDRADLILSTGEVIPDYFLESGMERLIERVQTLSEQDLWDQIQIIHDSLVVKGSAAP